MRIGDTFTVAPGDELVVSQHALSMFMLEDRVCIVLKTAWPDRLLVQWERDFVFFKVKRTKWIETNDVHGITKGVHIKTISEINELNKLMK